MADDPKLEMLRGVSLFATLGRAELETVARLADEMEVPAGKVLMRQGETGQQMFVIASGSVLVERDGRELARLGPGDVVGEMALLSEGPRTATATAAEPTTVFVVAHREFHSLLDVSAEVRRCVLDSLAKRIRALDAASAH